MTALPLFRSLLLAGLCLSCADAMAQRTGTTGNAALRIGIRVLQDCEIGTAHRPDALPTVTCSHPLAYQVSIDGSPAPSADAALALGLPSSGAATRASARYATFAF